MRFYITIITVLITAFSYSQNRPKSMSNGGNIGGKTWTIEDYQRKGREDSLRAVRYYNSRLKEAEVYKPKEEPKELKKKGWFAKNIIDTKDEQRKKNELLKKQQKQYDYRIESANASFAKDIADFQKYRNEWVAYLKAKKIADAEAKEKREIEAEKKRIQDEIDAKEWQVKAKAEQEKQEAELKAMPTNPEYLKWKGSYEKALSLSQKNVDKCNAIIKKYTFKNAFGQKIYDSSDFSKTDKNTFNQNLDMIFERSTDIRDLEDEKKYYFYWNDTVSTEKSTWSYRISSYFNSTSKVY